ncbi:MAG: aminoacetone oxidase family FAD-binding enzyme [Campylobacterales bacterium]|nr:aminoacetone oxidase family FAD-binding enzyme [Campylobacterales bacterium]
MKQFDVLILGAGASGLMCAAQLAAHGGLHVGIIEGNDQPARKLRISGGGKCNLTNTEVDASHYLGDAAFVQRVLDAFSRDDLLEFVRQGGIKPVIRKERYYFCPESSEQIITLLRRLCGTAEMLLGHRCLHVSHDAGQFIVTTDRGTFASNKLVVASGAQSYQSIGASTVGLEIAKSLHHPFKLFHPVLVGLTLQSEQFWMKELSGVSMPVCIRVGEKSLCEDLLFAHKGISGPAVLSASLYWHKGEIEIDFLPQARVERLCARSSKQISTLIPLPKRFLKAFLSAIGLDDKPCSALTPDEQSKLERLHAYRFAPAGNFGFTKAEACRGGVAVEAVDPCSMQSRSIDGLYWIGEVLDVTGELGGYNFQWAFSSAVVCARNLLRKA